jgi:uroporphyrinogen decarboxylase
MFKFWTDFIIERSKPLIEKAKIDYASVTEDMAYTTGPHISPTQYREFMLPHHKKLTSFLKVHGIDIVMLDCSGNINVMMPLFLEAGFNSINVVQVNAGMDAINLRKQYGKRLTLIGNISLQSLIEGGEVLEKEVRSKVPWLIEKGGYIPSIDDIISPDVPLRNYIHYVNLLKELIL